MLQGKVYGSCAYLFVRSLKAERNLFKVALKPSHCFYSSVDHRTKVMASPPVVSWDSYFKENRNRLVSQYEKKYAGKEKKVVSPELNGKVAMWNGNITMLDIDAIVNAANSTLLGGGGVDGAIHRAAGPALKEECSKLGGCQVGEAKITGGYKLPAKHVIHTVGPQGEKPDKLKSCYNSSLQLMLNKKLRTVAFPCISTGVYGYPQEPAAHVALSTVRSFLEQNKQHIDRVIFCLFLPEDVTIYENLLQLYFPVA